MYNYTCILRFFLFGLLLSIGCLTGYANVEQDSALWEHARRMRDAGNYDSAFIIYDSLYTYQDSVYKQLYSQNIEPLREKYKLDELELENERQLNQFYLKASLLLSALTVLGLCCWFYLKRSRLKLIQSNHEMEKAKEMAELSMHNKSLFLSNMSHEIRTPLGALVGFADLLAMDDIDEETRQQGNDIIRLNSELLLKLINDVVDISCIDIDRMQFNIDVVDAVALCRNVVETIEKVKRTEAVLSFETELAELELATDVSRLQQVMINLLVNATKFTPQGSIVLKLEQKDNIAYFSVTDTGCGIPKEKQDKIFHRFEKLNEKVQGFGLGLSICELIVKRLEGRIWIDSEYQGGARFIFTHPMKQKEGGV